MTEFANPGFLAFLVLIPIPFLVERFRSRVAWPSLEHFRDVPRGWAGWPRLIVPALRSLAIAALVIAIARPRTIGGLNRVSAEGVGIILALDRSSSMKAEDFPDIEMGTTTSRLSAARRTASRFVAERSDDLMGLVVFANYPDVVCPPTLDHVYLLESIEQVTHARPGDDGTNLGDAIAWSLKALEGLSTSRKVIVLLTDGRNSPAVAKPLAPEAAAELANSLGVTLHTIAIGRAGGLIRQTESITGLDLLAVSDGPNLPLLERLATIAGGQSFVANDASSLSRVFAEIDELEKSPVQGSIRTRYHEYVRPCLYLALAAVALDITLALTRLRALP